MPKKLTAVGKIVEIHGPVVVIACDQLPPLRQALCITVNGETIQFEVHQHLNVRRIRAIIGLYSNV